MTDKRTKLIRDSGPYNVYADRVGHIQLWGDNEPKPDSGRDALADDIEALLNDKPKARARRKK